MKSLDILQALLPEYEALWPDPPAALEKLNAALTLDPKNALALAARAEVHLKLDKPGKAMEDAQTALNLDGTLDRAHDTLGTALLMNRLPALAVQAFGKATALDPKNPNYPLHRASAYMMLDEKDLMCQDLRAACALGECSGLAWAEKNGMCSKTPAEPPALPSSEEGKASDAGEQAAESAR